MDKQGHTCALPGRSLLESILLSSFHNDHLLFPFICSHSHQHQCRRQSCIRRCQHPSYTTVICHIPTRSRPYWRAFRTRTGATTKRSVPFLRAFMRIRMADSSSTRRIQNVLFVWRRWTSPTSTSSPALADTRWASSNHAFHACCSVFS